MKQRGDKIDYALRQGCEDLADNDSRRTYLRGCKCFCEWLSAKHGIKYTGHIERAFEGKTEAVRAFLVEMVDGTITKANGKPYSAATISTYTKGVCHALNISYKEINQDKICPKRTADRISKGTGRGDSGANTQGREQLQQDRFSQFVLLAEVTGARRSELERIRGRDLVKDESGYLCVQVERGKGGKRQLQRILPGDEKIVRILFEGVRPKQFVLDKDEIRNKIDVHHIRAKRSQRAYDYYLGEIRSGKADQIRAELLERWQADHIQGKADQDRKALEIFRETMNDSTPYRLRGANKRVAQDHGRPTEYNRLALLAVSVFHLSHWRLDVTAVNYLSR